MKLLKFTALGLLVSLGLFSITLEILFFKIKSANAHHCGFLDPTCSHNGCSDLDPTCNPNLKPITKPLAEKAWGEAGAVAYPAAASIMRGRNGSSRGLDGFQKERLRPHFGNLVDQVVVVYGASMMDEWCALGKCTPTDSAAQTYCDRIYVRDSYRPDDIEQLKLLAHELIHSRQCEQLGGAGKFGFHYFREFKRAGLSYENNKLEKEAFSFQESYAIWLKGEEVQAVTLRRCRDNNIEIKNIEIRPTNGNLDFRRQQEWNTCSGYKFIFQDDGNLVLYNRTDSPIWAAGTNNRADLFSVQSDGNVVLYGGSGGVWETRTGGNPGAFLAVQLDGNVVVYSREGRVLWSSNTNGR